MKYIKSIAVAVILAMAMLGVAQAGNVSSSDGIQIASADGTPVHSADSGGQTDQTGALSAFMLVAAVAASPLTIGGSFATMAVAWPAVIGAVTSSFQAVRNR